MKVVIAIDSFKGSVSSLQAAMAMKEGILHVEKGADVVCLPIADGGEGTLEALTYGKEVKEEVIEVHGPLLEKVLAKYAGINTSKTAIIELSQASGITLLTQEQLAPYLTTTYGVGEMIKDAIHKGYRHFIIGIGGSCSNDGGVGLLQALGFGFKDEEGKNMTKGGIYLEKLSKIEMTQVLPELKDCTFEVICDVNNPLCGLTGASAIYGPQKGATKEMIERLDNALNHYAKVTKKYYPESDPNYPGSGAAGGTGFALHTFLHAELKKGISIILREIQLEKEVQNADLVITGEGRLDEQTSMGKAPVGVAEIAKKYHVPVIALAGCIGKGAKECNKYGIDAYFPILQSITTLEEAMSLDITKDNLRNTIEQVYRLYSMHK